MMALKADKHEVEDVKASKSNKADADLTLSFIDQLHKYLSHSTIIMQEYLKMQALKAPMPENEKA